MRSFPSSRFNVLVSGGMYYVLPPLGQTEQSVGSTELSLVSCDICTLISCGGHLCSFIAL